jgi:RNA 2',3'-cyclic 3'-phosphodiesterase
LNNQIPLFQPHPPPTGAAPRFLFFALCPDAAAADRIHNLAIRLGDTHGLEGKITDTGQLHVTLCFLGSVSKLPPDAVLAADTAARTLEVEPFPLRFDRVKSFPGSNAFVLCQEEECSELIKLRNRLLVALSRSGRFPLEKREFRAHVTLMHDPKLVQLQEVEPIGWTVRELLLMRSHHGLTSYQVLGRYPLSCA